MDKVLEKTPERFTRQLDILNPDVCNETIYIIGAGATGSFAALALAKMGFSDIRVYDEDTVEDHNFPNQLFPLNSLERNKAEALKEIVYNFTGEEIQAYPFHYEQQELSGIVVSALDSMSGRQTIFNNAQKGGNVKFIIDPRTGKETIKVLTVNMKEDYDREWYESTLHSDEESEPIPCTARSIIYTVLVVSAFVAKQVKLIQMNQAYKKDLVIDLKNDLLIDF